MSYVRVDGDLVYVEGMKMVRGSWILDIKAELHNLLMDWLWKVREMIQ